MSKKTDRKKAAGAESVRLDKLLAQEGFGTRSELGRAIRKGSVCVNGEHVKRLEFTKRDIRERVMLCNNLEDLNRVFSDCAVEE